MSPFSGSPGRGRVSFKAILRAFLGGLLAGVVTCLIVTGLLYLVDPQLVRTILPILAAGTAAGVASALLLGSAARPRPSQAPAHARA
jgi:hypothetical protein